MHPTDEPQRRHRFSEGPGFGDPYEGFDLDAEFDVDPSLVDPVDSHVLVDLLDPANYRPGDVDVEVLLDVGLSYVAIERYEQAIDTFERVVWFVDPDTDARVAQEAWVNRGVAHAQLGELDEAIGAAREAISIDADPELTATAETNLAYALWESGDSSRPLAHAERAVERDPRNAHAWFNLGYLYNERALSEFALEALDHAVELGLRAAWVHDERARALEALGEDREAERATERADALREGSERRFADETRERRANRDRRHPGRDDTDPEQSTATPDRSRERVGA